MNPTMNDPPAETVASKHKDLRKLFQENAIQQTSLRMSKRLCRRFSLECDTETNFSSRDLSTSSSSSSFGDDDQYAFQGPYKHIRETLDYGYHCRYRKDRQWLQDSIIDKLLHEIVLNNNNNNNYQSHMRPSSSTNSLALRDTNSSVTEGNLSTRSSFELNDDSSVHSHRSIRTPNDVDEVLVSLPRDPWLVYVVGSHDVSKSAAISSLFKRKHFPILSFVLVDPMEIQSLLPEYHLYVQQHGESNGSALTMKETGYIAEILAKAALQKGTNVIVFTSFLNVDWYPKHYQSLREEFKTLQIAILQILPKHERTTSIVNHKDGQSNFPQVDSESQRIFQTVKKLIQHVDCCCLLKMKNERECIECCCFLKYKDEMTIEREEMTWESFDKQFQQKNASMSYLPLHRDDIVCHRGESGFIQTFDVSKSTEENYKSDDLNFYGAYAHLRGLLVRDIYLVFLLGITIALYSAFFIQRSIFAYFINSATGLQISQELQDGKAKIARCYHQ